MIKKALILIVVLGLVLAIFLLFFNGTTKGTITKKNVPLDQKTVIATETKTYDDGYITWKYLGKYDLSKVGTTDGRVLTNVTMLDKTQGGGQYVINLSRLTQSLDDIPSVQMRRIKKADYTEEVGMIGDLRGLMFRTTDKKERVLFVNYKDTILTIAMTVNTNDFATTEKEWNDFLATVKWK